MISAETERSPKVQFRPKPEFRSTTNENDFLTFCILNDFIFSDGHIGDVYSIKLFPSGIVVLSCGSDMRIKIWSAEDGSNPATLTGHEAAVTDTCIGNLVI